MISATRMRMDDMARREVARSRPTLVMAPVETACIMIAMVGIAVALMNMTTTILPAYGRRADKRETNSKKGKE